MKETTDLDVELECSSVFDGNGIRPFWHVYCPEGLLIEDVRDGWFAIVVIHVRITKLGTTEDKNWRTV